MTESQIAADSSRRMLVVDDKQGVRQLLENTFSERGFTVVSASNGDEAIRLLADSSFDVVITDLKMPGRDGIAVLRAAKEICMDTEVVVVTAYGTIETAVEAMRLGAHDFILKPFKLAEIEQKVDKILRRHPQPLAAQKRTPAPNSTAQYMAKLNSRIVGDSEQTQQLLATIRKLGPNKSSVLITGPSGVGKELVAREIHDCSDRRDRPFIALNCAALAPGVLESELFGHEKGAFTGAASRRVGRFERAHTGTLFLDEVGEIAPHIQTKLLRVVQESEFERVGGSDTIKVDVRVVAATNRDLLGAIQEGLFREDFYYRLKVFSLSIPSLRERRDDIPALVDHFIRKFNEESSKHIEGIDDDVMNLVMRYSWPGNVRELENVIERAVILSEGPLIISSDLPQEMFDYSESPSTDSPKVPNGASLIERADQLESELIYGALQKFRWNKTKTAEHLGLKRTTLQYKIRKYGLE